MSASPWLSSPLGVRSSGGAAPKITLSLHPRKAGGCYAEFLAAVGPGERWCSSAGL